MSEAPGTIIADTDAFKTKIMLKTIIILSSALLFTGFVETNGPMHNPCIDNSHRNGTENNSVPPDTIKSLRETYPDCFIYKIDTSYSIEMTACLVKCSATNKARQSYFFVFTNISDKSDAVLNKEIFIELWYDYDAFHLLKYMGIDDFGEFNHSSTDVWNYLPDREIILKLKLKPTNKDSYYYLLDATLI